MTKPWYGLLCAGLLLTSLHLGAARADAAATYDYDRSQPPVVRPLGQRAFPTDVVVTDIQFMGAAGEQPTRAWLVAPRELAADQLVPGVLFVHWGGRGVQTHRDQFLDEAIAVARRGAVALLPDAMWAKRDWWPKRQWDTDLPQGVAQVVALRRAVDVLQAQPGVDPARLALVGHDFGAMFGSVVAAADHRFRTLVLLTPTSRLADWYLYKGEPPDVPAYTAALAPLDPIDALPRLAPASVLLQFAENDPHVPAERAIAMEGALGQGDGQSVRKYTFGHDLHLEATARADRMAWLERELGMGSAEPMSTDGDAPAVAATGRGH
jgi:dienelactone hydrolase